MGLADVGGGYAWEGVRGVLGAVARVVFGARVGRGRVGISGCGGVYWRVWAVVA
ncbi:hypothetical protein CLV68_3667 [Actinokineospora cianjurensis]|uniref:Uncharacterized protein n=1 Tax=Actinokineospora cianjurensis TaxID=585224 RepID=A0A421B4H4_9PSEU|nr:hypothetical protein CLV68_3667 [Actinokineospora cianjurensis]